MSSSLALKFGETVKILYSLILVIILAIFQYDMCVAELYNRSYDIPSSFCMSSKLLVGEACSIIVFSIGE